MTNEELLQEIKKLLRDIRKSRLADKKELKAELAEMRNAQVEMLAVLKEIATKSDIHDIRIIMEDLIKPYLELTKLYMLKQKALEQDLKDLLLSIKN